MIDISLKEFFEAKFTAAERLHTAEQDALKLQAKEYERRLESLNHEQARIGSIQATYVPREVFDNWRHETEIKLGELREYRANMTGRLWGLGIVIGITAAAIQLLAKVVFR